MRIEQTTGVTIAELWDSVELRVRRAETLESAAHTLASALYTQFTDSVVLARLYLTVRFDSLPPTVRAFVESLAASTHGRTAIRGAVPVLSLVGTYGVNPSWNDRRNSRDHKGIPLFSSAFVEAIPMIARLLREIGVPLDWIDSHDAQRIATAVGRSAGLFFVEQACDAVDHKGRKIISAQDFVSIYGVQSVFGTSGVYSRGQMLVLVVFCRDRVPRATAEQFVPFTDLFKAHTTPLVESRKIFADE